MEAQLADDRKKLQKAALGLHDSDDEDSGISVSIMKIQSLVYSEVYQYFHVLTAIGHDIINDI